MRFCSHGILPVGRQPIIHCSVDSRPFLSGRLFTVLDTSCSSVWWPAWPNTQDVDRRDCVRSVVLKLFCDSYYDYLKNKIFTTAFKLPAKIFTCIYWYIDLSIWTFSCQINKNYKQYVLSILLPLFSFLTITYISTFKLQREYSCGVCNLVFFYTCVKLLFHRHELVYGFMLERSASIVWNKLQDLKANVKARSFFRPIPHNAPLLLTQTRASKDRWTWNLLKTVSSKYLVERQTDLRPFPKY